MVSDDEPTDLPARPPPPTAAELFAAAAVDYDTLSWTMSSADADIDVHDEQGFTAVHLAIFQNDAHAVYNLLHRGASVELRTSGGKSPMFLAVEVGSNDIVENLLSHGGRPDLYVWNTTALHEAVRRGHREIVQTFLNSNADANTTTPDMIEPLYVAVASRRLDMVKLLLDYGADPDAIFINEDHPTALHLASHHGDTQTMLQLLDAGAKVDPRDFEGATPLFRAVEGGHMEAVQLLLQRGANTRIWRMGDVSVQDLAEDNIPMLTLLESETVWQGPRTDGGGAGGPSQPPDDSSEQQHFTTLKPSPPPAETDRDKTVACEGFEAMVTDFYTSGEQEQMIQKTPSVYELLYSHGPEALRSTLGDRTPDFTWYHLPANNMVWAETLVRRIAAEKGGVSREVYDEVKANLDLAKNMPRRRQRQKQQQKSSAARTLRSYSRRVTGPSPISADGVDDCLVTFIPFLHFETHSGYAEMAKTIDGVVAESRDKKFNRPINPPPPPSMPPMMRRPTMQSHRQSRASQDSQQQQGSEQQRPEGSVQASSVADSSLPSSEPGELVIGAWTRTKLAIQSAKSTLGGWFGRQKPVARSGSYMSASDLESQSQDRNSERNPSNSAQEDTVSGPGAASLNSRHTRASVQQRESERPTNERVGRGTDLQDRVSAGAVPTDEHHEAAGDVPGEDNRSARNDTERSTHPARTSRSSRRASTIPPPRRQPRRRADPPTDNLHEYLIRGYYRPESMDYQLRRTLDQYGYAGIETTSHRDEDQVVYRYTKSETHTVPKMFMVDHLWLWVLGKDTIITCSPLRWHSWVPHGIQPMATQAQLPQSTFLRWVGAKLLRPQPKMSKHTMFPLLPPTHQMRSMRFVQSEKQDDLPRTGTWPVMLQDDPINVSQLITRYLSKQSRGAVNSVHDLATVITTCCIDIFDPYQVHDDFEFFDFFERSINKVNDKVARYLRQFREAIQELRIHKRDDVVLDIIAESELMIEIEDILDELHILKKVLKDQEGVITELNRALKSFTSGDQQHPAVHTRTLENHLLRIEQMEETANKVDTSIHRLMDLKQKQASLAEAKYARESARDTARQGKTIIVFTVVTIIFLPISFIAAVFSIDTDGFPLSSEDKIPFAYVMRSIFTIGLAVSVPLVLIAFNVERIAAVAERIREHETVLWKTGTVGAVVVGLAAAVFAPFWVSGLSTESKVAVTVVLLLLGLGGVVAVGLWRFVTMARSHLDVSSTGSSGPSTDSRF